MSRVFPILALILVLASSPGIAQEPASVPAGPSLSPAPAGETGPVPVPEASEKAMRYYRSGNILWAVNILWGFAVPLVLLFTGLSARMRDWARRLGRRWYFEVTLYFTLFTLVTFLINLPLSFYQEFLREHAYGLSNQAFGKWLGDAGKGLAVGVIGGALFFWVPYLLLEKAHRRWWLYTGLLAVPFFFFLMWIGPIWVEPLFNKFGPMKDKALEASILSIAERAGIEGSRVYEVEKSVDTKAVNAYVTGFLRTKRIVLWDTLLAKLAPRETLVVMAHEMGHYVLGHVVKGVFFFSALVLFALYAIHRTAGFLIARFKGRWGFTGLADVASLPLLMLLLSFYSFVLMPLALAYSRHGEHEADRFALEVTRDNRAAATAFVKLQEENLGNPRPGWLYKVWRASHPPIGERIEFCNTYRPWETGAPLRYERRIRPPE